MALCWFCEKNPADPEAAVLVGFETGGVATSTIDRVTTYEALRREVPVPRCKDCEDRMGRASNRNILVGTVLFVFLAAGFLVKQAFPDLPSFYNYAFPCGGAMIGAIIGIAISLKVGVMEEGIKSVDAALLYPAVKEMQKRKGWKIDEHWR
ncbi:MAG: hypothetical protein PVF70_08505 [Anaerolineales bacterium]|jgi:hypothetical protein